ncbi:MAG: NUDIX domain-containing protein [Candidatus Woesearchaeota archaeon]|jgi:8-oxo-dGTP pyrophosphatase MutT (NUDIX family)
MDKYSFQICQKIVVFSKDHTKVLLCKRKGEQDLDGIFTFIGGKLEVSDDNLLAGLQREKNEEVSKDFHIKLCPTFSVNHEFTRKSGHKMFLPHYYAVHFKGEIQLNEEYSEYKWVALKDLDSFEPKVETIPAVVKELLQLRSVMKEFVVI